MLDSEEILNLFHTTYLGGMDFDDVEQWVDDYLGADDIYTLVAEIPEVARSVAKWTEDNGFGDWSTIARRNQFHPVVTMSMGVACYLHELFNIGEEIAQ